MGGVNCRNCKCNKDFDDDFENELNGNNGKKDDDYIYDNNLTIISCNIEKKGEKNSILKDKNHINENQIINKKTNEGTISNNNIYTIDLNNPNNNKFFTFDEANLIKDDINFIEENNKNQNNYQTDEEINLKNTINSNLNNQIELNNNNKNKNIDLNKEINIEMDSDNFILSEMNIQNIKNNNPDYLLDEKEKIIKNKNLNNILDDNSGNINISNPENTNLYKNSSISIIKNKENYTNNSNSKTFTNNNITNNTINNLTTNTNNNKIISNKDNTIKIKKKNHKKIIMKLTKSNRSSSHNQNNILRNRKTLSKGKINNNKYKNDSSEMNININSKPKYIYEYNIGNIEFGINIEEEDLSTGEQKLYQEAQKNLEQFFPPEKNEIKNLQKVLLQISLRNILTKEKLIHISKNEDSIIFHSELNKLINYEINAHTKMYSSRFCIITTNDFKYYKSKTQFLMNLNPLCIISIKHILRVNFAKINRSSKKIDHIIICNKNGVFRNNNSILGHMFDNAESNSFINCPENNESLLIFTSDDLEIIYKWFLILQFMLERNKKNDNAYNKKI